MTCQNDTAPWGSICPDCGVRLPQDKGPMTTWMAERHRDARLATYAKLSWEKRDSSKFSLRERKKKAA
jgi:hypothetical protein